MTAPEKRAFSYFQHVAAPTLSGPLDSDFWTRVVLQLSSHEPAVRHAVLTIGTLYENFQTCPHASWPESGGSALASLHYDKAVQCLQSIGDKSHLLLMCLLFTCIEFLRSNTQNAISHCRHAINILNGTNNKSKLLREYLEPAFTRLSIFPYFFGASPETFPSQNTSPSKLQTPFKETSEAHAALVPIVAQAIRFVRAADSARLGNTPGGDATPERERQRQDMDASLDKWFAMFHLYRVGSEAAPRAETTFCLMEMQWLVCKIWIATCQQREETAYDAHTSKFRRIVDLAKLAEASMAAKSAKQDYRPPGPFTVEMGFTPFLAFVMIKCRCLELRVAALDLMKSVSLPRESLWDYGLLSVMGRRTIEIEHQISPGSSPLVMNDPAHEQWPSELQRIKDSLMDEEITEQSTENPKMTRKRRITFLMSDPEGPGLLARTEWLVLDA